MVIYNSRIKKRNVCEMYLKRLKELREERGLTCKQVGEVLGKDGKKYRKIENGKKNLKISELIKLCDYYDVTPDYLLERDSTVKSETAENEEPG